MADFKEFTDKFVSEVANVANYIGNQAGKMMDSTKLKITISNQEAVVDNMYKKLGRHYYERFKQGEEIDEPMIDVCQMIETHLKSIKAMKEDLKGE